MKRNSAIVAAFLAASTVFIGNSYAQGPGCNNDSKAGFKRSSMQQDGTRDPGARVEQRLTRFKNELKLTPQQEPLWQAFAEKSKAEAGKGMQALRERAQDGKALSAPERMAQRQGLMQARVTAMGSINESFTRLYSALSPEQKQAADKHFSSAGKRAHGSDRRGSRRDGRSAPDEAQQRRS
ncbi:MAG: Spy/CpxP family protein refolding chaperone [Sulfuritalea sp.]|nr:Spy/CpxP family protein refolding chaperone [Sulfuritalea sp.]